VTFAAPGWSVDAALAAAFMRSALGIVGAPGTPAPLGANLTLSTWDFGRGFAWGEQQG
jgi:hypothetical protein